jgi:hypothetical protein
MPGDQDTTAPHDFLERSAVPLEFPQFRNSGALAHLAHVGRGPRYVVVGGRAWYDPQDIRAWLELNKRCGPKRDLQLSEPNPTRLWSRSDSKSVAVPRSLSRCGVNLRPSLHGSKADQGFRRAASSSAVVW